MNKDEWVFSDSVTFSHNRSLPTSTAAVFRNIKVGHRKKNGHLLVQALDTIYQPMREESGTKENWPIRVS